VVGPSVNTGLYDYIPAELGDSKGKKWIEKWAQLAKSLNFTDMDLLEAVYESTNPRLSS
jgi:hypothetical protein